MGCGTIPTKPSGGQLHQGVLGKVCGNLRAAAQSLLADPTFDLAKVVYYHKAAEGVTPESVAKANFGAGISSGGTAIVSASSMGGDQTGRGIPGGMPDIDAMMAQVMAMSGGRGGFPGMLMQQAPKEEGVTYLCVTDVQIPDRKMEKPLSQSTTGQTTSGPKVQQMRMVGHVRQKDLDVSDAISIIQDKISPGMAG